MARLARHRAASIFSQPDFAASWTPYKWEPPTFGRHPSINGARSVVAVTGRALKRLVDADQHEAEDKNECIRCAARSGSPPKTVRY
jgi:hypothetical protein